MSSKAKGHRHEIVKVITISILSSDYISLLLLVVLQIVAVVIVDVVLIQFDRLVSLLIHEPGNRFLPMLLNHY